MRKIILIFSVFILPFLGNAQKIDSGHPSIIKLQEVFNAAIKSSMVDNKQPWSSAVVLSDAVANHTLNSEFRNAEAYLRATDYKSTMQHIDSCLQFHIIFQSFATAPELSAVKITNEQVIIDGIQKSRRTLKYPRIALESINLGNSLTFCELIQQGKVERANTDFNDEGYFNKVLPDLKKLANELKDKHAVYRPEAVPDKNNNKMRCTFFKGKEVFAQVLLSFARQDYFGKIQKVEFVQKDKIVFDPYAPIEIEGHN
jgi:hemerythrin